MSESVAKSTLEEILQVVDSDEQIEEYLSSKGNLYTSFGVRNRQGEFCSIIDIPTVVSIIRELLQKQK
jgi:hypothetical protein